MWQKLRRQIYPKNLLQLWFKPSGSPFNDGSKNTALKHILLYLTSAVNLGKDT